jgi:hypothetical protein
MNLRAQRSLRHEYSLYVDRETEQYKETVGYAKMMDLAAAASAVLEGDLQIGIREMLLADEVNRLIMGRLKLPSFEVWRRRLLRNASEPKNPEHWGLRADTPLAYALTTASLSATVVVTGARVQGSALYLAANGCQVTALEPEQDMVERVLSAAAEEGLDDRVRGVATSLWQWEPDGPLDAVICTPAAFAGLSGIERAQVIALLQSATSDGGVHLVETIIAGQEAISEEELRASYKKGWDVSFHKEAGVARTFLAKKHVA